MMRTTADRRCPGRKVMNSPAMISSRAATPSSGRDGQGPTWKWQRRKTTGAHTTGTGVDKTDLLDRQTRGNRPVASFAGPSSVVLQTQMTPMQRMTSERSDSSESPASVKNRFAFPSAKMVRRGKRKTRPSMQATRMLLAWKQKPGERNLAERS